ncbi:hypothetical protein T484DRAFT_1969652 [Baffinella frigidus]|nr:hypothetical protein T484DRAFT_1969652 [Cryptophyta sp. CCMP2293]
MHGKAAGKWSHLPFGKDKLSPCLATMLIDSVLPLLLEWLGDRELLALRGTNRELRALASEDHLWADSLHMVLKDFPLDPDELAQPAYPARARGESLVHNSLLPCEAERVQLPGFVLQQLGQIRLNSEGVLEDLLRPDNEDAGNSSLEQRTAVYKARPLPLRCELCDVECDSYASFTAHCTLFSHKVLMEPWTRFDQRFQDPCFQDPRHAVDGYEALSTWGKFEAMHRYRTVMVAWFRAPMNAAGLSNMADLTKEARRQIKADAPLFGLSARQLKSALRTCTTKRVAEVCVEHFVVHEFLEYGLEGLALEVVEGGWGSFEICSPEGYRELLGYVTGIPDGCFSGSG